MIEVWRGAPTKRWEMEFLRMCMFDVAQTRTFESDAMSALATSHSWMNVRTQAQSQWQLEDSMQGKLRNYQPTLAAA